MIVLGFVCCTLAGFFEWRFPTLSLLSITQGVRKKKEAASEDRVESVVPNEVYGSPVTTEVKDEEPLPRSESEIIQEKPVPKPSPQQELEAPKVRLVEKSEGPSPVTHEEPEPAAAESPLQVKDEIPEEKELTKEEQRNLERWSKHINQFNQTFEQCMKCGKYVFMDAKVTTEAFIFTCPECLEVFRLRK